MDTSQQTACSAERAAQLPGVLCRAVSPAGKAKVHPMRPTQGRRTWFKVFVDDWLEGTTRYQMSGAERAFWIDLLAMAGRSRFGGIVCSGKDGEQFIGYPLSKFQGLLAEPIDIEVTFALFERTGKITMQVSGEGTRKLYVLFITNWARYQSEYDRTKKYRKATATTDATDLPQNCYAKGNKTEVEGEVDKNICANPSGSHEPVPQTPPKPPDE